MLENIRNFTCGCLSGIAQVVVQQPFQIIKVRLVNQTSDNCKYNGIIDCVKKIVIQEGPLAFYKGTLVPLLGVGLLVSMQFGTNQLSKKFMEKFSDSQDQQMGMGLIIVSGMLVGLPCSLAVTPIDHLRIVTQAQHGTLQKYHGSVDAGYQIIKKHGLRGLYLGYSVTLIRQVIAMGTYFGFYQWAMRKSSPDGNSQQAPMQAVFLNGGLAGAMSWLTTYPLDYVKTLIQSQDLDNRKYKSPYHCMKQRYRQQGMRTFYRGLGITLLRSFPVNGAGFLIFQNSLKIFDKKFGIEGGNAAIQ